MVAGFPAVDFVATLVDGSYHERDSSTLAFELAAMAAFREAFARAPAEALRKLGHTEAAPCLALKPGATLASPEQIKASRAKLEQSLAGIQSATCPLDAQEGM